VGPGQESVRSALLQCALHDREAAVRDAAVRALATGQAAEDFRRALDHRFAKVRCRALRALVRLDAGAADLTQRLGRALGDSHYRVRWTAAVLLAGLGPAAVPVLPALLRHGRDGDPRVREAAGVCLANLRQALPSPLGDWVHATGKLDDPAEALRAALNWPGLPEGLAQEFTQVCHRRALWHARRAAAATPSPSAPSGEGAEAVRQALAAAEQAPVAEGPRPAARAREALWLLAWLCERLLPGPGPGSAAGVVRAP
jgi:hypothetical protein